jgi:outer membrane autotransporter protein
MDYFFIYRESYIMSLVTSTTKSTLVRALLTSSVLIATVSYSNVALAINNIVDGQTTGTNPLAPGDFYNFDTDPSTFTVLDGDNLPAATNPPAGAGNVGFSVDDGNGGAFVDNTVLDFAGSSVVGGSLGPTNPINTIEFNGVAGALVTIEGTTNANNLSFANGGTVVFNDATTVGKDLTAGGSGSATFNSTYIQAAGDVGLAGAFQIIFNDDATIPNDLNLGGTGGAQIFTGKTVAITNDLNAGAGQLSFDLGLTATPGKFTAGNNANIDGNEVVNIINPGLASYAVGVNAPAPLVTSGVGGILAIPTTLNAPNNLFISFALTNPDIKTLNLVATRTVPTGLGENIQGVAGVLGTVPAGLGALSDLVNQLGLLTTAEQIEAMKSVAPLIDGAITSAVMDYQDNTFGLFSRRITELQAGLTNYNSGYAAGSMDERGHGTWIKLFGRHTDQNERDDVDGYKAETWGVAAGVDMMLTERFLVGVGLSWASIDVNHDLNDGDTDINSYQASLYGSWNICGPMFFNWMASAAYNDYDMTRHTIVGAFNQTTIADFHGWSYGAKGELGYVFGAEEFHITPMATLRYAHVDIDGYRENGPSTANQFVNYDDIDALWAGLGVKLSYDFECRKSLISPEAHANIAYDVIADEARAHSQFVSFGPEYETVGASPARTDYNLGLSLTTYGQSGLGMTISYDYNWRSDYHSNSGFVRVRYEW